MMSVTACRKYADITIVIPQFNHVELTCDCLRSLYEHNPCIRSVVVVDDGSTPECRERLYQNQFSNLRIIEQPHRGVTAAWNLGAAAVCTPYVIFLNNDVVTFGPWVERLIQPLLSKSSVISGTSLRRESSLPPNALQSLPTNFFLEGWCFAVSLGKFQHIGGFDEAMTAYWSDTDFQARLLREYGLAKTAVTCVKDLPLRHLGHRTAHDVSCLPNRRHIWQADRNTFISKWIATR